LRALNWVRGPREINIAGNSTLSLPEGYVYLDAANTAKFEELNQNLSGGKEVMIAPKTLQWSAYLIFEDERVREGHEKIDADAILKTLKENTEASKRGAKNAAAGLNCTSSAGVSRRLTTRRRKRLEWATSLQSQSDQAVNFFTKVLDGEVCHNHLGFGARKHDHRRCRLRQRAYRLPLQSGRVVRGWRPGDKVAEYGLNRPDCGRRGCCRSQDRTLQGPVEVSGGRHCRILESAGRSRCCRGRWFEVSV